MRTTSKRASLLAVLLLSPSAALLAGTVTCPGTVFDDWFGSKWTLTSTRVVETGGISFFGVTIIESEITMAGTYKSSDGRTLTVDCADIRA
jgi:hypothetical protein